MDPETPEWPLEGPCAVFGSGDCKRIPIVMPRRPQPWRNSRTVNHVHTMQMAVDGDVVAKNPASKAKAPRGTRSSGAFRVSKKWRSYYGPIKSLDGLLCGSGVWSFHHK